MAWAFTNSLLGGLYNANLTTAVPNINPTVNTAATGASLELSASQTGLSVAAAGTTNSTIFDLGAAAFNSFRCGVMLTAGAGTSTAQVQLQISSSSSFASDVVTVDERYINANVAAVIYSLTLSGNTYDAQRRYVRVNFVTGAGTSFTADIALLCA